MLFFSKLADVKVSDQAETVAGKLMDIAIKLTPHEDYPAIAGILVKNGFGEKYISSGNIESFNHDGILLNKKISESIVDIPANEKLVLLKASVLDKQIVDLSGIRVVRVNDLQFGIVKGAMSLVALDIGKLGILRRLGFGSLFKFLKPELLEWKDVRLVGDKLQLSVGVEEIVKLHPADIANIIEKLNLNQGSELLQALDKKTAARVLEELEPEIQKILVENLGPERATSIIQKMSIDELVDLIQMLPDRKTGEFISNLSSDSTQKVKKIIEYDENTAGGLMNTEFISAFPENTVEEVVGQIKKVSQMHRGIHFVYITDKSNKFLGVVSMRKLLISGREVTMGGLVDVKSMPTATADQDVSRVASIMTKYNLLSVAVLDKDGKLLGVITVDDIMRHFVPHA
ncbi:MAG: CBS domain-containing protein [Patescibacteria group bacterium]